MSLLNSIVLLFEFETLCLDLDNDHNLAHENILGVCQDGEKPYMVSSDLRLAQSRKKWSNIPRAEFGVPKSAQA